MALQKYGMLKGEVIGHLRDADDDHYQVMVLAKDRRFRIAINVRSSAPNAPSTVLFSTSTSLPDEYVKLLRAADDGANKLPRKAGGIALDYLRSGLIKPKFMKPVPPDKPGVDNDLKDKVEDATIKAMAEEGTRIVALGERWGPEQGKPDKYFKFSPGNGIHDIHMNQGNTGKYKKDNGIYQDGALVFLFPGAKHRAFFFAFQSQSFETDDNGNVSGDKSDSKPKTAKRSTQPKGKRAQKSKRPLAPKSVRKSAVKKVATKQTTARRKMAKGTGN
jgi:uncharacterized protein YukJ